MDARFLAAVLGVPLALILLGCVPFVGGFFYSAHGGIAWFLLPLCLPYIFVRLAIKIWKLPAEEKTHAVKIALVSVILYVAIAYPLARLTELSIRSSFGLQLLPGTVFKQATWPVGKLLPPYYTREEMENPDLYRQRHSK